MNDADAAARDLYRQLADEADALIAELLAPDIEE